MAAQNPAYGNLTNEQTWRRKTRQMETLQMYKHGDAKAVNGKQPEVEFMNNA